MAINTAVAAKKDPYEHQEYPKWVSPKDGKPVLVHTEEEEIALVGPNCAAKESHSQQIERLAKFLSDKIPEEVHTDEGAVDCAIRLLKMAVEPDEHAEPGVEVGNALTAPRRGRPPRQTV